MHVLILAALKFESHIMSQSVHVFYIMYMIPSTVKVYMTECATIDTPGPYWYKIEAISNNQLVGEFENPIPAWRFPTAVWLVRAGVAMCMDNSVSCI